MEPLRLIGSMRARASTFAKRWGRRAAALAAALALSAGGATARAQSACDAWNCDANYECAWRINVFTPPKGENFLEVDHKRSSGTFVLGFTQIAALPLRFAADAWSSGPRAAALAASTQPCFETWIVRHISTCPACRRSEGRGRASAVVAFQVDVEIDDPLWSDALADAHALLQAEESTTRCKAKAEGGAMVATSGWVSVGASAGFGSGGGVGASGGSTKAFTQKHIVQLFSDDSRPPSVEAVAFDVTMTSALTRAGILADGTPGVLATARAKVEATAFRLELSLECDRCADLSSKANCVFPQ